MLHRSRCSALALLALAVCSVAPPAQASPTARGSGDHVVSAVAAEPHPVTTLMVRAFDVDEIHALQALHADRVTMVLHRATVAPPGRSAILRTNHRTTMPMRLRGSYGLERWNAMRTTLRHARHERNLRQYRTRTTSGPDQRADSLGSRSRL